MQAVQKALSTGVGYNSGAASCGTTQLGSNTGTRAKGYVTIDVVSHCTVQFPTDAEGSYFAGPNAPILFDNVLAGDYQQIGPSPAGAGTTSTFDAEGGPMVHIHAVPEGGLSGAGGGEMVATNLPFTFYDRYTPSNARTADRRQPLPSVWAARYIQGGSGSFATDFKIWREGVTAGLPNCQTDPAAVRLNSSIIFHDIVRFDEHENSYGLGISDCVAACATPIYALPLLSRMGTTSSSFPTLTGTDVGGWFYLNLNSGARDGLSINTPCHAVLSAQRPGFGTCNGELPGTSGSRTTTQSWVISSMFGAAGAHRLAVDFDAVALGNGCTPAPPPKANIGPASQRNGVVCPRNASYSGCGAGSVVPPLNP